MATPLSISFRPNDDDVRNLALLERSGLSRSEAIRTALRLMAQRQRQHDSLAAEADALRANKHDCAVVAEIRDFFGDSLDGDAL
jgi:hypothetical protein